MPKRCWLSMTIVVVALLMGFAPQPVAADPDRDYARLVALFSEWRGFQQPVMRDGVPDYRVAAMTTQHRELASYQRRLASFEIGDWPVGQQIDWWLVWAEMNGLDFDHRVLRPWERDPAFYAMLIDSESDTPLKEGPVIAGAVELWRWEFPLTAAELARLDECLTAVPALLDQARENLTGDARDLWRLGIRSQQQQVALMADLIDTLGEHHPESVAGAEVALAALRDFVAWLEEQLPHKTGPSGVGIDNYTWYLRNVHLVPLSWEDEVRLMQRELGRSISQMTLEEHQNRHLPPLLPPADAEEWEVRNDRATNDFMEFLDSASILEVEDYMEPALRARLQPYSTPETSHFFAQVNLRDPRVLHCHFIHWIEKAYMLEHPHSSPIRRLPALYNIWDSRSEGLATGMEEMMLNAGMFADSPRSRELVYVMLAMRAARALAGLRVQSNEWTVDEAVVFAARQTPRGWFKEDGNLVLFEQQLYLRQPGYGTSYVTGKALLDQLLAEVALEQGDAFRLQEFMTELFETGMIPVSLGRWEMTGVDDWLPGRTEGGS